MASRRQEERVLRPGDRLVVKVGSGVISGERGLDAPRVQAVADDLCRLLEAGVEVILVSSGAIAAGKADLGIRGRPRTIPQKQAAAAIGQSRVINAYKEAFGTHGRKVAQVLLTRDDLTHRRRYLNAHNTLKTLLEYGVTPVINENDTVVVEEIRFGDNDNLSAQVASLMEAQLLVILSDVDGLYDVNPAECPEARLIPRVERIDATVLALAGDSSSSVGTGGMMTKVAAARTAALAGIGTLILNGRKPGLLPGLLTGEQPGTRFLPAAEPMSARKRWLAFSKTVGSLLLDDGACRALARGGKSLLPSGINQVQGSFERGDVVELCDLHGRVFAKGTVDYSRHELEQIKGCRSSEIDRVLGYKYGDEVVHRDNLVVLDGWEEKQR